MAAPDNEDTDEFIEPVTIALEAGQEAAGQRLDQWLAARLAPDLSRNRIQALIKQGAVRIGGSLVDEAKRKLAVGDHVSVDMPEPEPAEPLGEDIPLDILYEDDALIVIDKPAGLVVHPGAGNWTGTLVNALIHHCGASLSGIGGVRRPGIVHRLDKDTSGVMVVAKTDHAHRVLSEAFADHGRTGDLARAYVALVWGIPERAMGTVDAALGRHADRVRRAVVPEHRDDARHAVTHFTVEERFGEGQQKFASASLVECRLETGRTHQIRVHMAHAGYPLAGDPVYGRKPRRGKLEDPVYEAIRTFPRQALHAHTLSLVHPGSGEAMKFTAPMPDDFMHLLAQLEGA